MRATDLLTEGKETWYHGSAVKISHFTLDKLSSGTGIDQEGPGIYLTSDPIDARKYGQFVHVVQAKINKSRLMPDNKKIMPDTIRRLIYQSPVKDDALSNWDENPNRALTLAVNSIYESYGPNEYRECMEQIWYDFYVDHSALYLSKMRVYGWDGFILPRTNCSHFICFSPDILTITGILPNES